MLSSRDRFARQNRFDPPPDVSQASVWPSIVHRLSGPNSATVVASSPIEDARALLAAPRGARPSCRPDARARPFDFSAAHNSRCFEHLRLAALIRLRGPCFKTGRNATPRRRAPEGARATRTLWPATRCPGEHSDAGAAVATSRPRTACREPGARSASTTTVSRAVSIPLQGAFQLSLALHSTLSESRLCSVLPRVLAPSFALRSKAALLRNGARLVRPPCRATGRSPSADALSSALRRHWRAGDARARHSSEDEAAPETRTSVRIRRRTVPSSLAATTGIPSCRVPAEAVARALVGFSSFR